MRESDDIKKGDECIPIFRGCVIYLYLRLLRMIILWT